MKRFLSAVRGWLEDGPLACASGLWEEGCARHHLSRPAPRALLLEHLETRTLLSAAGTTDLVWPSSALVHGLEVQQAAQADVPEHPKAGDSAAARSTLAAGWDVVGPSGSLQRELLAWGDFNGDGRSDLAVSSGGHLRVLLAQPDGTFQSAWSMTSSNRTLFLAEADFSGSGHLDLLTVGLAANGSDLILQKLAGDGHGAFQAEPTQTARAYGPAFTVSRPGADLSVTVGDLLGNGRLDLMTVVPASDSSSLTVRVMVGDAGGTFQTPLTLQVAPTLVPVSTHNASFEFSALAGDLNGDGKLELMTIGHAQGSSNLSLTVLSSSGQEVSQSTLLMPLSPVSQDKPTDQASSTAYGKNDNPDQWVGVRIEVSPASAAALPPAAPAHDPVPPTVEPPVPATQPPPAPVDVAPPVEAAVPRQPSPDAAPEAAVVEPGDSSSASNDPVATAALGPDLEVSFTWWLNVRPGADAAEAPPVGAQPALVVRVELGAASKAATDHLFTAIVTLANNGAGPVLPAVDVQHTLLGMILAGNSTFAMSNPMPRQAGPSTALAAVTAPSAELHGEEGHPALPERFSSLAEPQPDDSAFTVATGHRTPDRPGASVLLPGRFALADEPVGELFGREPHGGDSGVRPGLYGVLDGAGLHLPASGLAVGSLANSPTSEAANHLAARDSALTQFGAARNGLVEDDLEPFSALAESSRRAPEAVAAFSAAVAGVADQVGPLAPLLGTAVSLGDLKASERASGERAALRDGGDSRMLLAEMMQRFTETFARLLQQLYRQFLGRSPVPGEDQGWVQMLLQGHSEENVLAALLGSDEAYAAALQTGFGTPDERYIRALYAGLLDRPGSDTEVSGWLGALPALGRDGVALFLLRSQEYRVGQIDQLFRTAWGREGMAGEVAAWVASPLDLRTIRLAFETQGALPVGAGQTPGT